MDLINGIFIVMAVSCMDVSLSHTLCLSSEPTLILGMNIKISVTRACAYVFAASTLAISYQELSRNTL